MTALEVHNHNGQIEEIVASAADISIEYVREGDGGWLVTITTGNDETYLFWAPRFDLLLRTRLIEA